MPKIINFRKIGHHAGDDLLIQEFINKVLTQNTVWQAIFVASDQDTAANQILNEIAQQIQEIPEDILSAFGLNKSQALSSLRVNNYYLSMPLYTCYLENGTTIIITYKQILAATYQLLTLEKPAEKQEIPILFAGILQNSQCAGGRANTCVEHYNSMINQRKKDEWKILPTNVEYLLHYLINFYSLNPHEMASNGVIPKAENNKFLQICWAIFENYATNNITTASEAIKAVVTGMSTREHFGGNFMNDRNNIDAARHSLKEYQDANGNISDLTEEQKVVLAQVFNQQYPYRQLHAQEQGLIQQYTLDEEDAIVFTPLSKEAVQKMWDDLVEKSMVFGGGIIPAPRDDVSIDFNNPNRNQPFIIGAVNNDYIVNHARLRKEEATYAQKDAEVYLKLSQQFFSEQDEICTRLFAATVSRNLLLFNNYLNLQTIMTELEDTQTPEQLLTKEMSLLKQLELHQHRNSRHINNREPPTNIDNKVGTLVLAEAYAYAAASRSIRLFLDNLSDEETINFFKLENQQSLDEAKSLGEELRLLNVRLFETIPSLLRKTDGSVHKGADAIIDVEDKYNQNPSVRSNKKLLQICYASIAEAVQHLTQADLDNDEDIKLIYNTFTSHLDENDEQHFEGMTKDHTSINESKQVLAEFRGWVVNGKQGPFPGLRPIDVEMLEELGVAKQPLRKKPTEIKEFITKAKAARRRRHLARLAQQTTTYETLLPPVEQNQQHYLANQEAAAQQKEPDIIQLFLDSSDAAEHERKQTAEVPLLLADNVGPDRRPSNTVRTTTVPENTSRNTRRIHMQPRSAERLPPLRNRRIRR